jgi:hypothetical protein
MCVSGIADDEWGTIIACLVAIPDCDVLRHLELPRCSKNLMRLRWFLELISDFGGGEARIASAQRRQSSTAATLARGA